VLLMVIEREPDAVERAILAGMRRMSEMEMHGGFSAGLAMP
jgi:hypothetical protein